MEEKIVCPICEENSCYEELQNENDEEGKAYLCMHCGFTSASNLKPESNALNIVLANSPKLICNFLFLDDNRNIVWFPSSLNTSLGIVYPESDNENHLYWFAIKYKLDENKKQVIENDKPVIEEIKKFLMTEYSNACNFIGLSEQ